MQPAGVLQLVVNEPELRDGALDLSLVSTDFLFHLFDLLLVDTLLLLERALAQLEDAHFIGGESGKIGIFHRVLELRREIEYSFILSCSAMMRIFIAPSRKACT